MENIFTNNPISVHVLDKKSFGNFETDNTFTKLIKKQVVWINSDDTKLINMWENKKIEKLKKKYGKSISNLLGQIKGGDDVDDVDDSFDIEIDDAVNIDLDDIEDILQGDIKEKKDEVNIVSDRFLKIVSDIHILPEDNITNFKHKIYAATKIPPYRQHLWFEFRGKTYPLSYSIVYNTPQQIDIRDIVKSSNYYEGLPVDTKWYDIKNDIIVLANDNFQLLEDIYYKYGVLKFFIVDLNDFIDPIRENLINLIKKDKYSIELIYYSFIIKYWPQLSLSVFSEYVKNEDIINNKYPDLSPNITNIINRYSLETKLIGRNYKPVIDSKKWDIPLTISINKCVVSVLNKTPTGLVINIRNLFDKFRVNEVINFIKCEVELYGDVPIFKKAFKYTKDPNLKTSINTISFNIDIPEIGNLVLILSVNGNYNVEATWKENLNLNFEHSYKYIEKYINTIINKINTLGDTVSTIEIPIIKKDNCVFSSVNSSMFWGVSMSSESFNLVKKILNDYISSGIFIKNNISSQVGHHYFFNKGMNMYNIKKYRLNSVMQNYYNYLIDNDAKQRYNIFITKTKRISFIHRFSDIRINSTGLKEQEYILFYLYMIRLLESIPRKSIKKSEKIVKKLKLLKTRDPVLYDFSLYDSPIVYSKLCQKQKQPILYTESGKDRIKFWNFTTQKPAWYGCDSKKFPYINFIVGKHPKNLCLPCCNKIKPNINSTDKKSVVYKECIEKREYNITKKVIEKSRYIVSYGKDIDIGRLSKLPETTLEPLFYNIYSKNNKGIDEECEKNTGYYIYGITQNTNNVSNVGMLFSISHALDMNIIRFINDTIKKIKDKPIYWSTLLDGTINSYFSSINVFIDELFSVFVENKLNVFDKWNSIFVDIANIYWNIIIFKFIDNKNSIKKDDVNLEIPKSINYSKDYDTINKRIIVIKIKENYYPIYIINTDVFFKNGRIKKKIYNRDDYISKQIDNIINYTTRKIIKKKYIDLHILKIFTKNSKYNIEKLFINKINKCYGVLLKYIPNKKVDSYYDKNINKNSKNILNDIDFNDLIDIFNKQIKKSKELSFFFPIKNSYYTSIGIEISFDIYEKKYLPEWKTLSKFMNEFNKFNKNYSVVELQDTSNKDIIYPLLEVNNWLVLSSIGDIKKTDKIIGFRCNNINYNVKSMNQIAAMTIKKTKMIKLLYDPYKITHIFNTKPEPKKDYRYNNIAKCLYDNNLYNILIIELINILNKSRNNPLRQKIKDIIKKININNTMNKELFDLLKDFPDDYIIIKNLIFTNLLKNLNKKEEIRSFNEFVMKKKMSKSDIYSLIDKSIFTFDKQLLTKLKKMSHKNLTDELIKIFSKHTIDKDPTFKEDFPNIIMSCSTNLPYCNNKKLMIKKSKLKKLLNLLASDILNPIKSKYLLSPMFVKNVINYLKFTNYKDENITITI